MTCIIDRLMARKFYISVGYRKSERERQKLSEEKCKRDRDVSSSYRLIPEESTSSSISAII